MLGFKASILENMKGYSQYGEDYKREEPQAIPYTTSHTKSSMDSELTGLEIDATPVIGNRKKVVGTELRSSMQEFDMPFDPHDDTSVYVEELDLLGDDFDGFTFEIIDDDKEAQQDLLGKASSTTLPPAPAPLAEMETPTITNGRKLAVVSTHSTAEDVVSVASFVVEELESGDEEDEFTWKTIISTKNMKYFLNAAKEYGEAMYQQVAVDRTDRQSNRTSDVNIDYASMLPLELGVFEDEVYGDAMKSSSSSGLGEDDSSRHKTSLEETSIKDEEEYIRKRTLKKKKSSRKLKKDSSSRSKRLVVCSDGGEVAEIISSPRSLKKKSSSCRKLKKDSSSKKLKKEPSSRKLKKESSIRKNLKKDESSSRSKKPAESEEVGDSYGMVKKSNHRTSKLLKIKRKSKSNRSSKTSKNLLSSPSSSGEEGSSISYKKNKVNLRDKLLRKSSSNKRSKKKQKFEVEDAPTARPTLKKKKASRKTMKKENRSTNSGGSSSRRSSFTQALLRRDSGVSVTSRLSNILRTSFTKDL